MQFVLENLSSKKLRILEVGCGSGAVAKQIQNLGYEIIALDSSVKAIDAAKELGIDARIANFPDFAEAPFDVILFTRSLHHIRPLKSALERAHQLLKPSGLLIVEDFAFNDTSEYTAAWFYRLLKLLDSCDVLLPAEDSFGRKLLKGGGEFSLWHEHTHEINTAQEVLQAIGEHFEILQTTSAAYLYRYVSAMVEEDERGGQIISDVLELEKQTGLESEQFLIGRRFVARR
ncbi:MAG: class I SAM-dependent methyltransferase [Pyrinomonadaceae bacterium]|nr:class I SAM-dependent methyltransferase [Pyrinomonadaceae bacterium]